MQPMLEEKVEAGGKQNEEIKDDSQNFSSSCQGDDNAPPTLQSKAKTGEAGLV